MKDAQCVAFLGAPPSETYRSIGPSEVLWTAKLLRSSGMIG